MDTNKASTAASTTPQRIATLHQYLNEQRSLSIRFSRLSRQGPLHASNLYKGLNSPAALSVTASIQLFVFARAHHATGSGDYQPIYCMTRLAELKPLHTGAEPTFAVHITNANFDIPVDSLVVPDEQVRGHIPVLPDDLYIQVGISLPENDAPGVCQWLLEHESEWLQSQVGSQLSAHYDLDIHDAPAGEVGDFDASLSFVPGRAGPNPQPKLDLGGFLNGEIQWVTPQMIMNRMLNPVQPALALPIETTTYQTTVGRDAHWGHFVPGIACTFCADKYTAFKDSEHLLDHLKTAHRGFDYHITTSCVLCVKSAPTEQPLLAGLMHRFDSTLDHLDGQQPVWPSDSLQHSVSHMVQPSAETPDSPPIEDSDPVLMEDSDALQIDEPNQLPMSQSDGLQREQPSPALSEEEPILPPASRNKRSSGAMETTVDHEAAQPARVAKSAKVTKDAVGPSTTGSKRKNQTEEPGQKRTKTSKKTSTKTSGSTASAPADERPVAPNSPVVLPDSTEDSEFDIVDEPDATETLDNARINWTIPASKLPGEIRQLKRNKPKRRLKVPLIRDENGEPVQLFRHRTMAPLEPGEEASDSDEEIDQTWRKRAHRQALAATTGLQGGKLDFTILFDEHLADENIQADVHMGPSILRFAAKHAGELKRDAVHAAFRDKLFYLRTIGVVSDLLIIKALNVVRLSDAQPSGRPLVERPRGDCRVCRGDVRDVAGAIYCRAPDCRSPRFHQGCVGATALTKARRGVWRCEHCQGQES